MVEFLKLFQHQGGGSENFNFRRLWNARASFMDEITPGT